MNKQELIDYCNAIKENKSQIINCIDVNRIIKKIEQLDESKKVTVPQFVADWYEKNKGSFDYNLWQYLTDWEEIEPSDFKNWINEECNIFQTLVNMHQFGYTVEKEELVKVRLKGTGQYLCNDETGLHFQHGFKTDFTKEYLEQANFGWVFDCSGIEIEEV